MLSKTTIESLVQSVEPRYDAIQAKLLGCVELANCIDVTDGLTNVLCQLLWWNCYRAVEVPFAFDPESLDLGFEALELGRFRHEP